MKKLKAIIFLVLIVLIFAPFVPAEVEGAGIDPPLKCKTLDECINRIVDFLFYLGVIVVPLMIIIAAYFFVTSGGDPERVKKGQNIIWFTILGFAIILLARGLVSVIKNLFTK